MPKSIVIIGTLDTKGDQVKYLKEVIEAKNHKTIVIDVGVMGSMPFEPNISRQEVAIASGSTLQGIKELRDKTRGMERMGVGATAIVKKLYSEDKLDGIVALGGSMGTAAALEIMKALPIGVPKLLLTTMAYSPSITPEMVGGDDIMMLPWVAGLWGLNSMSRRVIETAAGAIMGAVDLYNKKKTSERRVVGISGMGGISAHINQIKPALEARGYEVAVFHATGMSGRIFERAIYDGQIYFSLDLQVGIELLDHLLGGVCSAGEHRLEAAGKMGIPQIVSPGAIDAWHWSQHAPFPPKYEDHPRVWHNSLIMTVFSNEEECAALGKYMAEKLNSATGPTAVVIPMKGYFSGKIPGSIGKVIGTNPRPEMEDLTKAFRKTFMENIKPEIKVLVLENATSNDQEYIDIILRLFDEMVLKTL